MGTLSPLTKLTLAGLLLLIALSAVFFTRRQKREGRMGGQLSPPKQLWLGYAVFTWFFLAPLLALDSQLAPVLRTILGIFALNMWIRGVAELVMMYGTKNWRPPYGITHDVFSVVLLIALCVYYRGELTDLSTGLDLWVLTFVGVLAASLVLETYYAVAFHDAVEGQTTGDEAIWFASADDPRFRRINLITTIANVPLYGFLAALLGACWLL